MKLDPDNLSRTFQRRKTWDSDKAISADTIELGGKIYIYDLATKTKEPWLDPDNERFSDDWEYVYATGPSSTLIDEPSTYKTDMYTVSAINTLLGLDPDDE